MSRSGTPTTPNAARRRPMVTVTLAPGTLDACAALGGRLGLNRGEVIDRAVAEMASRLDMPATPVLPRMMRDAQEHYASIVDTLFRLSVAKLGEQMAGRKGRADG